MPKSAVIAKLTAQEGKRSDLVDALKTLVTAVESEPGTEVYALHTDAGNDEVVWFYELYTDQEALTAHGGSDTMKAIGPTLGGLLAGRPELTFLSPVAAKGLSL